MDTHAHAADAPERSHPLLWTAGLLLIIIILVAWFAHFYAVGAAHGREVGLIPPSSSAPKGPGEPDHAALIANKSAEVIEQGAAVFAKGCASCHGPQGNANPLNMNPPPRNFWTEDFKSPNGAGPYGLYIVVSDGFNGRMPAQKGALSYEDRYAVVHFLRESIVKPNNPKNYQETDSKELLAKVPKKGDGAGTVRIPAHEQPIPKELFPLMKGVAETSAPEVDAARAWLKRAIDGSDGAVGNALLALDRTWSGNESAGIRANATAALVVLSRAVKEGKAEAIRELLLNPAPGSFVPEIGLLPTSDLDALIAQLRKAAPPAKPAAGVH